MARKKNQEQYNFSSYKRPQLNLKRDTRKGLAVVLFVVLAIIFTLSLVNVAGPFGSVANQVLKLAFGWVAYVVPLIFLFVAIALFRQDPEEESNTVSTHAYVGAVLLTLTLTGLLHLLVIRSDVGLAFALVKESRGGGYLGVLTAYPLMHLLGFVGSLVVLLAGIIVSLLVTFNISFTALFKRTPKDPNVAKPVNSKLKINNAQNVGFTKELVTESNKVVKEKSEVMVNKMVMEFGIDVEMGEVNVGPTVTQYTFRPAVGVKLSQIASLQNDLALALAASSIRMELPIPGKALVGIEIPNNSKATVRIREIIGAPVFVDQPSKLAFALGRDVAGHPMIADLSRMPHLLIAGATGSGKSIALNSLLISWLYRATPQEVKFIIIDPKKVEMSLYNGLPHLLTGVIIDHQKAVNALK